MFQCIWLSTDCNVLAYCLQLSCMCLCQCLTYSLGQTPHPQIQYTEAVAWPAGERLAYPSVNGQKAGASGQHECLCKNPCCCHFADCFSCKQGSTQAHMSEWCWKYNCGAYMSFAAQNTTVRQLLLRGAWPTSVDHTDSNIVCLSACYCLHASLHTISVVHICPCHLD